MSRFGALILIVSLIQLAGCAGVDNNSIEEGVSDDTPSLGTPYTRGPTGPPSVNGPSGPPGDDVDAVTETDETTYSLPGMAESEFKQ